MSAFKTTTTVELEKAGEGMTRQIMGYTDHLMLVRVFFKEGAIGYTHTHPHEQVSIVEKGRFEVTVDGKSQILEKGDAFTVTPGLEHGAVCLEEGILIDTFSPMREDFLPER